MTGTGFMKCIPMTLPGLLEVYAILVIEIEDEFDAKMASSLQTIESLSKIFFFKPKSSLIASITQSTSFNSSKLV